MTLFELLQLMYFLKILEKAGKPLPICMTFYLV